MIKKRFTVLKTLRLTPEEEKHLQKCCEQHGMKEAEYFRFLLSQKPNDYPEFRILMKELINEVNHIGVNINQVVRNINSGIYSEYDKQHLLAYMKKLNVTMDEVVRKLGN